MFNLEQAIADWRRRICSGGIQSTEVLDELESHLREEVERRIKSGLSGQQAFATAADQIGRPEALKTEFAKACHRPLLPRIAMSLMSALMAAAFLSCWFQFGRSPAVASVYCVVLGGLIVASFIDFEYFLIPDQVTIGGIFAGVISSALLPNLHGQQFVTAGLFQSLLGIAAGGGLVYIILRIGRLLFGRQRVPLSAGGKVLFTETSLLLSEKEIAYEDLFFHNSDAIELQASTVKLSNRSYENVLVRLTRTCLEIGSDKFVPEEVPQLEAIGSEVVLPREVMGFGDVKLMGAVGAFLGWQAVISSLVASSLIGSLVGVGLIATRHCERSSRLPYGPFVAVAATIWIFGGKHLVDALFAQ
jgi:leader peptidase (prepilin peptidase)/N-methyltransferase